ncbi:MAG: FG-GAP repeat protein, partial [Planctomycetes bacterium]|nr:FG-GAP repeat protein [Planctomycetota bacterium]
MKTRRSRPTHRLAAAAVMCVSSAGADWNPPSRYGPVPANAGADLGRTAALDGDWAVAGARRFGTSPNQAGGVFVFHRDAGAWSSGGVLQAGDRTASDEFGGSVALSGGQLAVGAPFDDPRGTNSGSAYVFSLAGGVWSQTARLVPGDGQAVDLFGTAVGLADGWLLCGAPLDDDSGIDAGSVYAFHYDGAQWVQVAKFAPGAVGDQFGTAISSSADAAAVGAPFDDDVATDAAAVHVYRRSGDA